MSSKGNDKDNSDVFIIESKRASHKSRKSKDDDLYLDNYTGHDWGERLSFTVGMSYMAGFYLFTYFIYRLYRLLYFYLNFLFQY